jgi:hypothetical protein
MTDGHADQREAGKATCSGHVEFTLHMRVRWWLRWYLRGVAMTCRLTGLPPDFGRVEKWTWRAIRFQLRTQGAAGRYRSMPCIGADRS